MTEEKFIEVNEIFNNNIKFDDLNDNMEVIDFDCVIHRVNKKCKNLITKEMMVYLTIFNSLVAEDKYEAAMDFKKWILINCK